MHSYAPPFHRPVYPHAYRPAGFSFAPICPIEALLVLFVLLVVILRLF
jgi:hypothetical protein